MGAKSSSVVEALKDDEPPWVWTIPELRPCRGESSKKRSVAMGCWRLKALQELGTKTPGGGRQLPQNAWQVTTGFDRSVDLRVQLWGGESPTPCPDGWTDGRR